MVEHQLHSCGVKYNMLGTLVILLGVGGQLCHGAGLRVPLEPTTANFSQFFDNRIVGGSIAPEGYSRHMAALVVGFTWPSFVCGGSIISPRHILTAAHCITGFILWEGELMNTFHAIVGTNNWQRGTMVEIEDYALHPQYDPWIIKSDAGVLLAKYKIKFNDRVAPIGLNTKFTGGGEKCSVAGWGTEQLWGPTPNELKKLHVETITTEACNKGVQAAAAEWGGWAPHVDPWVEICTFHSPGHGMCHGDSGSALVSFLTGYQIGIVSWGVPCARGGPDVYVRVSGILDFLEYFLNNLK